MACASAARFRLYCFGRNQKKYADIAAIMASPKTHPTTAPAMAPLLDEVDADGEEVEEAEDEAAADAVEEDPDDVLL